MKNVSERVSQIIDNCKENYLELSSNKDTKILYNQREIVTRIDYYLNSRYLDRDDDAIFWNLSTHRKVHFAKHITPDTKDFLPYGIGTLITGSLGVYAKRFLNGLMKKGFTKLLIA